MADFPLVSSARTDVNSDLGFRSHTEETGPRVGAQMTPRADYRQSPR